MAESLRGMVRPSCQNAAYASDSKSRSGCHIYGTSRHVMFEYLNSNAMSARAKAKAKANSPPDTDVKPTTAAGAAPMSRAPSQTMDAVRERVAVGIAYRGISAAQLIDGVKVGVVLTMSSK